MKKTVIYLFVSVALICLSPILEKDNGAHRYVIFIENLYIVIIVLSVSLNSILFKILFVLIYVRTLAVLLVLGVIS